MIDRGGQLKRYRNKIKCPMEKKKTRESGVVASHSFLMTCVGESSNRLIRLVYGIVWLYEISKPKERLLYCKCFVICLLFPLSSNVDF